MYMQVYNSKLSNHLKNNAGTLGLVVDVEEEIGKKTPLYSKGLRALIAETLLVNPSDRVAVRELASRTKIGLDVARKNAGPGSINSPGGLFTPEDEPMLDPGVSSMKLQFFSCIGGAWEDLKMSWSGIFGYPFCSEISPN